MKDNRKRLVILCLTSFIFLGMVYQATILWVAWHWERSNQVTQQLKGAKLTPGDAEAWDRIGEAEEANFDAQPSAAIDLLRHAVDVNPLSARNWMDLAQAYEASGDIPQASAAYEKAQLDYPISGEVAWNYGNFLLRHGQVPDGLQEVHRSLLSDPHLIPLAISRTWRSDPNVKTLLHDVLPQYQQARFYALNFFAAAHEQLAASETWNDILNNAKTARIDIHLVFPFLQDLIAHDQTAETQQVWSEAVKASGWPAMDARQSPIWNGGFEEPIANGGLDWRLEGAPGTYISIDTQVHHSAQKSLRVDFTGGFNVDFTGVHEIVPVQPKKTYKFEYFMKTQDISTDSGMRFEILDLNDNEVNLTTSDLTGTNKWTSIQANVVTGQNTHFLDVRLRRIPSRLFDSKLSGTVWVDDVSLIPEAPIGSEARP